MRRKRRSKKMRGIWKWRYWAYQLLVVVLIYIAKAFEERHDDPMMDNDESSNRQRPSREDIMKAVSNARHDRLSFDPDSDIRFLELVARI